jgi:hypothetical protein
MSARLIAATGLALGVLAAPATAAPTLEPLKPCYVSAGQEENRREAVMLRGTGFTPQAMVDVYIDGVLASSGQANVVGDIQATVPAPFQEAGEREFAVTVAEQANPAIQVGVLSRVTALDARLRPRQAPTRRRVRYIGRGFTGDAPVYVHYVFGGKARKTVRLARRPAACGTFSVRRRQIPVRRPRPGVWTLQVDQRRAYRANPGTNWVRIPINVREVFVDPDQATAGSAVTALVRVNRS